MTRQEILVQLRELPHPIAEDLVVFEAGCECWILTSQEAFFRYIPGRWPVSGPYRLTRTQQANFAYLKSWSDGCLEDAVEERVHSESRRKSLLRLIYEIGEDVVNEVLRANWPSGQQFYAFEDDRLEPSVLIFSSVDDAYDHFFRVYTLDKGVPWESMTEEELSQCYEMLESWRAEGSKKLPPDSWLGASYYS